MKGLRQEPEGKEKKKGRAPQEDQKGPTRLRSASSEDSKMDEDKNETKKKKTARKSLKTGVTREPRAGSENVISEGGGEEQLSALEL